MSVTTRPAAVAGVFYPADPLALGAEVDAYLAGATDHGLTPKAVIAPHAGYRYSAPVAASVYAGLRRMCGTVRRVVLLGPAHRVAVKGMAAPSLGAFETPLGLVPIDAETRDRLVHLRYVVVDDEPHAPEHSLEVHLPFLQRVLGTEGWSLLPLAVGAATTEDVADVIERCWGGPETLFVISSDLSHYHDYETAQSLDERTARAIERLRPEDLGRDSACGVRPVMGMLLAARRRGMRVTTLDVRNSGDTQPGNRDRVVGYGGWSVTERSLTTLSADDGRLLATLATSAVEHGVRGGSPEEIGVDDLPARLHERQAAFVTLEAGGQLRGCVGGVEPATPLARAVVRAASSAALADRRFPPLTEAELPAIDVSVSVLSPLERMLIANEAELVATAQPGVDGLVMSERSGARGVFLPQVWDQIATPAEFVARLKLKAGLATTYWSDTLAVYRFTVEHFE